MDKKYKNILVTGGAGFIGSFLVDKLIKNGYKVRILDNLEKQVHQEKIPLYLNQNAEFIKGDVRDYKVLKNALTNIDAVFHLAATVGVAQSNYQIKKYSDTNIGGTSNLLDILVNENLKIKKIMTVSSMTGYGEGNYKCVNCGTVRPSLREELQLKKKDWNLYCPNCQRKVEAVATDEKALDFPNSVYGLSKKVQQDLTLLVGKIYKIPTVVLKGFNVYGPRQSLSNPYTGVTAIFISRLKNKQPLVIYEDGQQTRDFVSVHDMVEAFILAMEKDHANNEVFNIGSGRGTTILEIARTLSNLLKESSIIKPNDKYRINDIRHCFADTSKVQTKLGWRPKVSLEEGLKELIEWSSKEKALDKFSQAQKELQKKGLT